MTTTQGLGSWFAAAGRRARARVPARLAKSNRKARGAAELSVVMVTGSLVAGVFFGSGLSHTSVHIADGLTWLSDSPSGEVVQVNPATGELQDRQLVGKPGDDLQVAQYDSQLYVTNQTTGQLMSFDLTSILVSGQRRVTSGGTVDTLSHDGKVFLVDKDQSTISDIDPVTTDAIGTIWVSQVGLADVAIDGRGTVWALEDDGTLRELRWSDDAAAFVQHASHHIDLSGQSSVLVAHDQGVTVFGPDNGIVQQVGTGADISADAPKVEGTLMAPENAPDDIVPVSTDDGMVVIVTPDHVQDIDMATLGCAKPGTPEVFTHVVYVPCQGDGKVVKLDTDGNRVGDDIETPGSRDPELVLDDTNLVINTPGAPHGVVVHDDGTVTGVVRQDPAIPVTTPAPVTSPPAAPVTTVLDHLLGDGHQPDHQPDHQPSDPPSSPPDPGPGGATAGPSDGPTDTPTSGPGTANPTDPSCHPGRGCHSGPGQPPTTGPTSPGTGTHAEPMGAPTNVSAVALPEGQVQISWDYDVNVHPDGFIVKSTAGTVYATVKGYVRQAVISVTPGQSNSFTVSAVIGEQTATSKPTTAVTTTARPDQATVSGSAAYHPSGKLQTFVVTVTWTEAPANGSPVSEYDVSVTTPDGTKSTQTDGTGRTASFTWTCDMGADPSCKVGGNATATVTAVNALGGGEAAATTITAPPQPDPPLPAGGAAIVDASSPKTTGANQDGSGQITLKLRPPSDWAKFPGTCAYQASDGTSGQLSCAATTVTLSFNNGYIRDPASGTVQHSVSFTATNANGTATSKAYTYTSTQPTLCQDCSIP